MGASSQLECGGPRWHLSSGWCGGEFEERSCHQPYLAPLAKPVQTSSAKAWTKLHPCQRSCGEGPPATNPFAVRSIQALVALSDIYMHGWLPCECWVHLPFGFWPLWQVCLVLLLQVIWLVPCPGGCAWLFQHRMLAPPRCSAGWMGCLMLAALATHRRSKCLAVV